MFRTNIVLSAGKKIKVIKPPKNSKVSAYGCFVKQANARPEIAGLATFKERSKVVADLWKKMSAEEKQPFVELSKTTDAVSFTQRARPLKKGGWKDFVKTNYSKVAHLPFAERLPALKKMWKGE